MYPLPSRLNIDYPEWCRGFISVGNEDNDEFRRLVTDTLRPTIKLFILRSHGDEYFRWRYVREQLQQSVYHFCSNEPFIYDDNLICGVMLDHLDNEFRMAIEGFLTHPSVFDKDDIRFTITPRYSYYTVEFTHGGSHE